MEIKIGDSVQDINFGYSGVVEKEFKNWEDLKQQTHFITIDPDNESGEMDVVEKLINGDPKDKWLKIQEVPFSENELNERWFSVVCYDGGGIWSNESRLKQNPRLN